MGQYCRRRADSPAAVRSRSRAGTETAIPSRWLAPRELGERLTDAVGGCLGGATALASRSIRSSRLESPVTGDRENARGRHVHLGQARREGLRLLERR